MDDFQKKKEKIENYIQAYNAFNISGMLRDLHDELEFENVVHGEVNLSTSGIHEFNAQAEKAKEIFKERTQHIINLEFNNDEVEVEIGYRGILSKDLPNGLKAGDTIKIKGKSIFTFRENKIIKIRDES